MAALATAGVTGLTTALPTATAGEMPPVARATGPGPCVPGKCPKPYPEPHNGTVSGRDNAVNVFVGGDYAVREAAAGAEGRAVVLGDVDVAKAPGAAQTYTVGAVPVGSRVPPDNGTPFLRVGGAVKIAAGQRLLTQDGTVNGTVSYGGALAGPGTVGPKAVRDPSAVAAYRALRDDVMAASTCYGYDHGVLRRTTGTAVNQGAATVFTGDGTSKLQVFNAPFDLTAAGGGPQEIGFQRVPATATVLVNVTNPSGEDRAVNVSASKLAGVRRERLLWNFPDAKNVRLTGSGTLEGTVLVGRRTSTVRVSVAAVNGRFFTAGSLAHESGPAAPAPGATGPVLHAYPFEGALPDCGTGPTPEADGPVRELGPDSFPFPPELLGPPVQQAVYPGLRGGAPARPPRHGQDPERHSPPMSPALAIGTLLVAAGTTLALAVLYRTRPRA
ncbi:hypothetical protein GCM10010218_17900 [Streptomyces mashuensis]|uniref:Choice-of-anchor A domain-containing protein n=1 Tax=Streptomyces mashuensis TaxID=33904 RepID=A0A919ECL6_9ACTN|nr:hypothetical protein GCM10010218_17900 [Streptomyces mashuensis]